MNGFDPIITLNRHIALLTLLKAAEEEVINKKGVMLAIAKWAGREIQSQLEQSKTTMRANKMRVQDLPIKDRRYQYSFLGRRDEYEISQGDLDLNVRMVIVGIEQELEKLPV